jgi:hypothetical protein
MAVDKDFARGERLYRSPSAFQPQQSWSDGQAYNSDLGSLQPKKEENWLTLRDKKRKQKPKMFKALPAHLQSPEAIKAYINCLPAPKPIEAKPVEARWRPEPRPESSQAPKAKATQPQASSGANTNLTFEPSAQPAPKTPAPKKTQPTLVAATTLSAGILTQPQATAPEKTSPPNLLNKENSVIKDHDAFQKTTASSSFKQSQDEEKLDQLITPTQDKKLLALGLDSVAIAAAKRALKWLVSKGANISGHVAKRHVAKYLGKSMFSNGGKYAKDWTVKALKNPDKIVDQGRRIVFEKRFKREVGRGGEKVIRVVVDKATGKVVTAFPTNKFLSVSSIAIGIASKSAEKADAQIKDHRKSVENQSRPTFIESTIDLIVGVDPIERNEKHIEEQRIIERNIQEAIKESQKKSKRNLSASEKQQIREIILLEMDLTN